MSSRWGIARFWRTIADWWLFQMGTLEGWLCPTDETPQDRAIREEAERVRKVFPSIDFDHPSAQKVPFD